MAKQTDTVTNRTEHTKKALLEALEASLGVVTTACKRVGVSRTTFYEYMKDEEFKAKVEDLSEVAVDFVESKLFSNIKDGCKTSIIFYLKTKAKHRGYIERQELTGKDGKDMMPSKITFQFGSMRQAPITSEEEAEQQGYDDDFELDN